MTQIVLTKISYVFIENGKVLEVPKQTEYWCSGTNEGGVALCIWQKQDAEDRS